MTLTGKRGTLVTRNQIEWLDVPTATPLFTGTWKVVRGTGDYAGLAGGGRVAGVTFPNGATRWRREGSSRCSAEKPSSTEERRRRERPPRLLLGNR